MKNTNVKSVGKKTSQFYANRVENQEVMIIIASLNQGIEITNIIKVGSNGWLCRVFYLGI